MNSPAKETKTMENLPEKVVNRDNMDVEFYDQPEVKSLEVNFGSETLAFLPDNHYIVLYWQAPQYNRIVYTDPDGQKRMIYNYQELIDWMVGFKLDDYHIEVSRNNKRESMSDLCGWHSRVFINDRPDADAKSSYELAQSWDLYPPTDQLTAADLIEAWEAEENQE